MTARDELLLDVRQLNVGFAPGAVVVMRSA